jgi:IS30 family transposase
VASNLKCNAQKKEDEMTSNRAYEQLVVLVKLPHPNPATAAHVLQAFSDKLGGIAQPMRKSLTYDRGREAAGHAQISANTGMKVYFCDPCSPWQRGSNENTNGLLRQYFPKAENLSGYAQEQFGAVADQLNGRPRITGSKPVILTL